MVDLDYMIKDFKPFGRSYINRVIPGYGNMDIQSKRDAWKGLESNIKIKTYIAELGGYYYLL